MLEGRKTARTCPTIGWPLIDANQRRGLAAARSVVGKPPPSGRHCAARLWHDPDACDIRCLFAYMSGCGILRTNASHESNIGLPGRCIIVALSLRERSRSMPRDPDQHRRLRNPWTLRMKYLIECFAGCLIGSKPNRCRWLSGQVKASTEVLPVSQTSSVAQDMRPGFPFWNRGWDARYNLTE